MSAVKKLRVPNRLAAVVKTPGGKTVAEAVAAAEVKIDLIKDDCLDAIDAALADMTAASASMKAGTPSRDQIEALYSLSNDVFGIAGVFALNAVGEAAYSLCDLLDKFMVTGSWNWPAVEVHLNGLRVLRALGESVTAAQAEPVLSGLKAVAKRVTVASA